MSWFNLFKKAKANDAFSADELAMLESQARAEVEAVFSNGHKPVPTSSRTGNGAKPEPAYHRVTTREPIMARSTKRASVLPLRDWRTIEDVSEELGCAMADIVNIIETGGLARVDFRYASALVHIRQIAYYIEHKTLLDVDTSVFQEWKRQADIARDTGLSAQELSKMIAAGEIAVYKPAPRIVLLNEREVYHVATKEKHHA